MGEVLALLDSRSPLSLRPSYNPPLTMVWLNALLCSSSILPKDFPFA